MSSAASLPAATRLGALSADSKETTETTSPPHGNTGGKPSGVSYKDRTIALHWLRVVQPAKQRTAIRERLEATFGVPNQVRGRWFYEHGLQFSNGTLLMWGSVTNPDIDADATDSTCVVDVPGGALDDMEPTERIVLCRALSIGGKVTRLDVAVDALHPDRVGLIDTMLQSCRSGQLCGSKVWEPRERHKAGTIEAKGLCIGRRGKDGSGRYVRVYDKGLESECGDIGTWERFEVEFSGDCAAEVGRDLLQGNDDWEPRAWSRVHGAISFREVNDQTNLDRRPIVEWWSEWCAGATPVSTIYRRLDTTLETHISWLREMVLPTTARLAKSAKCGIFELLYYLVGDEIQPRSSDRYMRSMVSELRKQLKDKPLEGDF